MAPEGGVASGSDEGGHGLAHQAPQLGSALQRCRQLARLHKAAQGGEIRERQSHLWLVVCVPVHLFGTTISGEVACPRTCLRSMKVSRHSLISDPLRRGGTRRLRIVRYQTAGRHLKTAESSFNMTDRVGGRGRLASGRSACRRAASSLSGCDWMDSAVSTESTWPAAEVQPLIITLMHRCHATHAVPCRAVLCRMHRAAAAAARMRPCGSSSATADGFLLRHSSKNECTAEHARSP